VLGANFVQSHILHFYLLALPDFMDGPDMPPWKPSWNVDRRFDAATNQRFLDNYLKAVEMRRKAHEAGALFGGRMPHPPAFLPGGITTTPRPDRIALFKTYLNELIPFIQNVYIPDAELLGQTYSDYFQVGRGLGNLLAFGVFDQDSRGSKKLLKRGQVLNGSASVGSVDTKKITEHVTYSWYADSTNWLNPSAGDTVTQYPKDSAYSWLKAPRYGGYPYECGPLARMWVNGDYRSGISVMDRHRARAREALKVAQAMLTWVGQISGTKVYSPPTIPQQATSVGLTEAPRGAIGHWVNISAGKISRYQIVTPTCWNCSPRDSGGVRGPMEMALLGTPVKSPDQPLEVMRVIHSIDPCLSCAVHVMRPDENVRIFALGHYHSEEEMARSTAGEAHVHEDNHHHRHPH
jgi:hydrogenase large subunit